jgi:hypothetical protein
MPTATVARIAWIGKAAVLAMLLFAATHTDWDRFAGKAMAGRAVAYPLALLIIPAVWWIWRRTRPYPALADLLVTLPFVVDVGGNCLDLYDRIDRFDDACHFGNWAMLLGALAVSLPRELPEAVQLGLVVGLGSTSALLWELMEYETFIKGGTELDTAYTDTLGDMTLGTIGATLAGLLVLWLRRREGRQGRSTSTRNSVTRG